MGNYIISSTTASFGFLLMLAGLSCGNFPVLDVDTNMRIVLVPYDTPVGTIIYRLRASDSDNNFPLSFEVLGSIGKSILSLRFLGCELTESLCQADVVLKKALDKGRTYEFQLQVKDTDGDYTKVHSVITATTGTANFNPTFIPRIIHLDESTPVGTELEKFVVAKNELNSRHVFLEIRDKGDRIALRQRLVSNNKTEGTLLLGKSLDYETEPWFTFQLLAMNAYTNISCDTRNILVSQVIVAVHDVQDTPPYFTSLPASLELKSSMKPGDLIVKVAAEDGDKQNKRLIRYGFLTDSNPFVVFFNLDPMSGEIHLRRNLTELLTMAKPNEPIEMTIIAEEIIPDSGRLAGKSSSTRSSSFQDNSSRAMGKITFWFGRDSSFGPAVFSSDKFVGEVKENSVSGTLVSFGAVVPRVSHQHPNEIIALSLQPGGASNKIDTSSRHHSINNHIQSSSHNTNSINEMDVPGFQVLPSQGSGNFSFEIRVTDSKLLDYESTTEFTFLITAVTSCGLSSEAQITVHVRDVNDESPVFSQAEYHIELPEHPAKGTKVLQVQAIDKDTTGNYGKVTYSSLAGSDAFRLDPITGDITVEKPELIDRELEPEIRLYVEAKDGGYSDAAEPSAVRNLGTTVVIIKLTDKNDHAPEFFQKYYQAVLNPGLTELKEPLFLKAVDLDEGVNSQIRYQVKDNRFFVDPISGEFRLRGGFHRDPKDGDNPFLGSVKVYAYDLGNPKMTSETSIQLFAEEMVTREIQFIFPSPPDKIRKNKTNFEIMLSKLSGGVVAIQNVAPYNRFPRAGAQLKSDGSELETTSTYPGEEGAAARFRQDRTEANTAVSRRAADLQSVSDKSLVTATVQYPVSATPTRVDLSQIPNVYGTGEDGTGDSGGNQGGNGDSGQGTGVPDTDRIRIYEAENRALFWILISFLLILLLLFLIFLCCVYCPGCWLYGHCYSKGDKGSRQNSARSPLVEKRRRSDPHNRHKTYPEKIVDEEADYDREYDSRPPPGRSQHQRREAWSGEERKGNWRSSQQSPRSMRRYRGTTPPPRSRKVGPQPHETDVAMEDWEFDVGPPRQRDQAEEIGSRWQLQQQQSMPMQAGSMMPIPVAVPIQQPRRVVFGHPGQVEDAYIRRSQEAFIADENQLQRAGYTIARPVQSVPPGPDERAVSHLQPRKARFFRTETGEVLQFGDFEVDEAKEQLIKRYIDEQQPGDNDAPQQQSMSNRQDGIVLSQPRLDAGGRDADPAYDAQRQRIPQQGSTVDRPKAAIVTRRSQKSVSLSKDVTFEDDEEDEHRNRRKGSEANTEKKKSLSRSNAKKSKSTRRSESESEGESRKDQERDTIVYRQQKRNSDRREDTKSPTAFSEEEESRRSRSPSRSHRIRVSKSPSRSKTRSESPRRYKSKSKSPSRSKSGTRSRSVSPPHRSIDKDRRHAKSKQSHEKDGKQQRLRRHHHISKGSRDEQEREHRSHHHHHHRLKQRDSRQQQSFKDSREEMSRENSKSLEPSLISLPFSVDDTEPHEDVPETSKEAGKTAEAALLESTSDVRGASPQSMESSRRGRRRSSLYRQSSEDATQMQSMVDINIIPPSSARTDSSSNPKDADGMMSDGVPQSPDGESESKAQQPETTINRREKESEQYSERLDEDNEDSTRVERGESRSSQRKQADEADNDDEAYTGGETSERSKMDRINTIHGLENELASQSTLDIAEAEAAAAAVAPNDSVENPPPGDEAEPERSLDKRGPDEDDDSGIGMVGYLSRRNKMLEKKSVFTIAYDEIAQSTMMRPDTRGSTGETEHEISTVLK